MLMITNNENNICYSLSVYYHGK
ncbi:hypothetical protein Gotri_014341 [Gossypium trilobum]|uniref:Uncharacterized protein n=1 Tax=Gossypium trilobum TaxID=34281 RepID=A0A7J9DWE5_9ROSI|nr:hypothetical protein [Gossypium trilobum]